MPTTPRQFMTTSKKRATQVVPETVASLEKRVKIASIEESLKLIKKTISGIPEIVGLDLAGALAWCKKRKVTFPWPSGVAPADSSVLSDLTFDFYAPESVAVAGSFMLQSGLADGDVDLIAEMPDGKIFRFADGAKDHINWKYWLRRSFYLAVLEASIKDAFNGSNANITVELLHGNPFKPVLSLQIAGFERKIRIIPALPWSSTFQSKLFRLSPQRSNVRAAWIAAYLGTAVAGKEVPTPFYNASLLSEALYLPHLVHLHACFSAFPAVAAALKLLKAWLRNTNSCLNGFMASMWLAELIRDGTINPALLDELQIFRLTLQSWKDAFGGSLGSSILKRLSGFQDEKSFAGVEEAFEHGNCALLAGPMNLFYAIPRAGLLSLAQQADSTLSFLLCHPDRLDRLFLASAVGSTERFCDDLVFTFAAQESLAFSAHFPAGTFANYATFSGFLEQRIELVLRKGLTDRIRGPIRVCKTGDDSLRVSFSLDPLHAERPLDLGPSADQPADAAKFRGFWGKRAELRQFKDSSIRECVGWETEAAAKRSIPSAIVAWLLHRHFGIKGVESSAEELNFTRELLMANEEYTRFTGAFEVLARDLRGLGSSGQLPLSIVACVGLDSTHAQTSLTIPKTAVTTDTDSLVEASALLPFPACPVYNFLMKFEKSSAWPDERQALQAARQAFLLQLNRVLRQRNCQCLVGRDFIDIVQGGFVFRGWLEVPREALRCRSEGLDLEAEAIERRTFWQPRMISSFKHLAMRHTSFGPTCRLVKAFLSGQLIDFPDLDMIVDVLCAAVFLGADQRGSALANSSVSLLKSRVPGSHRSGFLRVLDLLATFPWTERPLVLDFTCLQVEKDFNSDEEAAVYTVEEDRAMSAADWSILTNSRISANSTRLHVVPVFTAEQKAMLVDVLDSSSATLTCMIPILPFGQLDRAWLVKLRLLSRLTLESIWNIPKGADWSGLFAVGADAIRNDYDLLLKIDPAQLQLQKSRIDGLAKMFRNSNQGSPLLFSHLPGFSASEKLVSALQSAVSMFEGVSVAWNRANPKIIGVRVRRTEDLDAVTEIVKSCGGDMILEMKVMKQ